MTNDVYNIILNIIENHPMQEGYNAEDHTDRDNESIEQYVQQNLSEFIKELEYPVRDGKKLFGRLVNQVETVELALFPNLYRRRLKLNKGKQIRDKIAFNICVLAMATSRTKVLSLRLIELVNDIQNIPKQHSEQTVFNIDKLKKALNLLPSLKERLISHRSHHLHKLEKLEIIMDINDFQSPFLALTALNFAKRLLRLVTKKHVTFIGEQIEEVKVIIHPRKDQWKGQLGLIVREQLMLVNESVSRVLAKKYFQMQNLNRGGCNVLGFVKKLTVCVQTFSARPSSVQEGEKDFVNKGEEEDEVDEDKNKFSRVTQLTLISGSVEYSAEPYWKILSNFPNLVSLKIQSKSSPCLPELSQIISQTLPLLESLIFTHEILQVKEGLEVIIGQCPYIHFVKAPNLDQSVNKTMNKIRERAMNIQNLMQTVRIMKSRGFPQRMIEGTLAKIKPIKILPT